MDMPLLRTKFYIRPVRDRLIARPHLIEQLNQGLDRKLTLISAPAGFGKTTLVADWLRQVDRPVAWLSLDENDNDLYRLLTYLIAALQQIDPKIGQTTQSLLQTSQQPSLEILVTTLINEILVVETAFVLVLDDFHFATDPLISQAVSLLLDHLPPQLHLLMTMRRDPFLPLSRLRARGQMVEIRADDLRFSTQEAMTFLNQTMDLALTPEDVTLLDQRTEGWITGLHLAALSMQGHQHCAESTSEFIAQFTGDDRLMADYLVDEVLTQQPEDAQDFLLKTAILERMTGPLCDVVTGQQQGQQMLERLEQANLLLVPLDNRRQWYRYHRLFVDFLQHRLQQASPEEITTLHARAARWYEHSDLPAEAIHHALKAEDFDHAAELIEQIGLQMAIRRETTSLSTWLAALPDAVSRDRPWLSLFQAWIDWQANRIEAVERQLQNTERILRRHAHPDADKEESFGGRPLKETETRELQGYITALQTAIAYSRGELTYVIETARQALAHLPERNAVSGIIALVLGHAYLRSGNLEGAAQAYTTARETGDITGDSHLAIASICNLGSLLVAQGQLQQGLDIYLEGVQIDDERVRQGKLPFPVTGHAYVDMSYIQLEWNDLENAKDNVMKGIGVGQQMDFVELLITGYVSLARIQIAQSNFDGAVTSCQQAVQLGERIAPEAFRARLIDDLQVRLWLGQGQLADAVHWASERALGVHDSLNFASELEHILLARIRIRQHSMPRDNPYHLPLDAYLAETQNLIVRLLDTAKQAGRTDKIIEIFMLQAITFQIEGQNDEAVASLEQALLFAQSGSYVRIFLNEHESLAQLLALVNSVSIDPNYLGQLRNAFKTELERCDSSIAAVTLPSHSSMLVEPLSDRELEVLRLMADGLKYKEIAEQLIVSLNTVRSHTKNIYGKLDVHSRIQAISIAKEMDLL